MVFYFSDLIKLYLLLLKSELSDNLIGKSFVAAAFIIQKGTNWPDIRRDVLKDAIFSTFLNSLLKAVEERSNATTELIYSLTMLLKMINHSKLKSLFENIVKLCFNLMFKLSFNENYMKLIQEVIVCLSLTPTTENGYEYIMNQLILGMHALLNRIYIGFEEDNKQFLDIDLNKSKFLLVDAWKLDNLQQEYNINTNVYLNRLKILVQSIILLLGTGYNFVVPFAFDKLLNLVRHLCLLDGSQLKPTKELSLSTPELIMVIPQLHILGYKLMESFLINLKNSIYPYISHFEKFITLEFNMSRNSLCFAMGTEDVKIAQYKLLRKMISTFKAGIYPQIKNILKFTLDELKLKDDTEYSTITSKSSNTIELISDQDTTKKRSHSSTQINPETLGTNYENEWMKIRPIESDAIRIQCYKTIEALFYHIGGVIDETQRKTIDTLLLFQFITMNRFRSTPMWSKTIYPLAFSNHKIRLLMYKVMTASILTSGKKQSTILPYAIRFFNTGINDYAQQVSEYCTKGILICNSIIHPKVPLLHPTISKDERSNFLSLNVIESLMKKEENKPPLIYSESSTKKLKSHDVTDEKEEIKNEQTEILFEYNPSKVSKIEIADNSMSIENEITEEKKETSIKQDIIEEQKESNEMIEQEFDAEIIDEGPDSDSDDM